MFSYHMYINILEILLQKRPVGWGRGYNSPTTHSLSHSIYTHRRDVAYIVLQWRKTKPNQAKLSDKSLLISKYKCYLKSLLCKGISRPNIYGDVVNGLRRILEHVYFKKSYSKNVSNHSSKHITIQIYCNALCLW